MLKLINIFSFLYWRPSNSLSFLDLGFGSLLLITAILSLLANLTNKWIQIPLWIASGILLIDAVFKFIQVGYQPPQLIELSLQISMPLFLWMAVYKGWEALTYSLLKIAVALTFIGHGWYAMGLTYGFPPHFIEMVVQTLGWLGITEEMASNMLLAAGILDVAVAIGIFIPGIQKYAAGYAACWGFLTAAARISSYVRFGPDFWLQLHQFTWAFFVRCPHFLAPLILYLSFGEKSDK